MHWHAGRATLDMRPFPYYGRSTPPENVLWYRRSPEGVHKCVTKAVEGCRTRFHPDELRVATVLL